MSILDKLKGGDPRAPGRANEVVADVLRDPSHLRTIFDGMLSSDAVVRMRSANVVERISAAKPELLQPFARRLLDETARSPQGDVQRQVAQVLPRIRLNDDQRRQAETILLAYLNGRGGVAKVAAKKALTDFALNDPAMRARIGPMLGDLAKAGGTAVRVRGRQLLERLATRREP